MMLNKNLFVSIAIISVFSVQLFPVSPSAEAAPNPSGLLKFVRGAVRGSSQNSGKFTRAIRVVKFGRKVYNLIEETVSTTASGTPIIVLLLQDSDSGQTHQICVNQDSQEAYYCQ